MSVLFLILMLANSKTIVGKPIGKDAYIESDYELIQFFEQNIKNEEKIKREFFGFEKIKVERKMEVILYRTIKETVYCPAVLNLFEKSKCLEEKEFLIAPDSLDMMTKDKRKCPIGRYCEKDTCDGISHEECKRNTFENWMDKNTQTEISENFAYLFHRCHIKYTCQFSTEEVYLNLLDESKVLIEGPFFKQCTMYVSKLRCVTEEGWVLLFSSPIKLESSFIKMACLKGKDEELCWDETEGDDFLMDENGNGVIDNRIYNRKIDFVQKMTHEPLFHSGPANSRDLESVYRILQYENLQSGYNILTMSRRIKKLEELVKSLIFFGFGVTSDPLHSFRDIASKMIKANKTHILITARIRENETYSQGPIMVGRDATTTLLFPSQNFSQIQLKRKTFIIEDYGESELRRLSASLKRDSVGVKTETIWFGEDFTEWVRESYTKITNIAVWVAFFVSISTLRIVIRRMVVK